MTGSALSPTRRQLLTVAGATAVGSLAGCSERLRSATQNSAVDQVSITVKTLPADEDSMATKIASQLAENLRNSGIDAVHEPLKGSELYRQVLIERDYDAFVAQHPEYEEVDALRRLLHSDFIAEHGWQNPFHFSNATVDELLETQRQRDGQARKDTFEEFFDVFPERSPFTTVAFPEHLGASREELELATHPQRAIDYVTLSARLSNSRTGDWMLSVGALDNAITEQLNPIAVGLGTVDYVVGLLYDPLIRTTTSGQVPWLAESIEWNGSSNTASLTATVRLREDLRWHDGKPITTDDVEFTYTFLKDTSLGSADSKIPASRYRGRTTLVDTVTAGTGRTIEFSFGDCTPEVARRALMIPILPRERWEDKTELTDGLRTEALEWDNENPVGSGLFAFADSSGSDSLELEPFEEHVMYDTDTELHPEEIGGVSFTNNISFAVKPNAGSASDRLQEGEIDLLATSITPDDIPEFDEPEETTVKTSLGNSFYMLGYNHQHPELGNPRFRQIISQLLDREHVVNEFFDGYAVAPETKGSYAGISPALSEFSGGPFTRTFPGSNGEVDTSRVMDLFEDAGYRYDDGELIT